MQIDDKPTQIPTQASGAKSNVATVAVAEDDDGIRLDRWFKRHYPQIGHGRVEKLARTGQIRVDGGRVKASTRLEAGQMVRVPPLAPQEPRKKLEKSSAERQDEEWVQSLVIHRDEHVIALNKPPGLAVQGGSKVSRHLDEMLDGLRFGAEERPRLVHRLDKDTSGILLLGRGAAAAASLADAFRSKQAKKTYWALTAGVPELERGRIDMPLSKGGAAGGGERMGPDTEHGLTAITYYAVMENAGKRVAWLALRPITGRTHQLRVHCATALKTPVLGDGKYGGKDAFLPGVPGLSRLQLHARSIELPHPAGGTLRLTADLPESMAAIWRFFEFNPRDTSDPFAELDE